MRARALLAYSEADGNRPNDGFGDSVLPPEGGWLANGGRTRPTDYFLGRNSRCRRPHFRSWRGSETPLGRERGREAEKNQQANLTKAERNEFKQLVPLLVKSYGKGRR
jgi:hypothetical protein